MFRYRDEERYPFRLVFITCTFSVAGFKLVALRAHRTVPSTFHGSDDAAPKLYAHAFCES